MFQGVCAVLLASAALAPACAAGDPADAAATSAYLQANYAFAQSASARIPQIESTLRSLQHRIGSECPLAAASSPEDTDSEQLSNEVIGTMVLSAGKLDLPAAHAYVRAVRSLRWSSASLTHEVHAYAAQVNDLAALAVPKLCADVKSWAASGYQTLPARTVPFDDAFLAAWVAPGYLPAALARFESSAQRSLTQRTAHLEGEVTEMEAREVSTWGNIMNELELEP